MTFFCMGGGCGKKDIDLYFHWLSYVMNDITKGVRGAKDYYIINTPILRAI